MELKDRIRALRERLGLSHDEMAERSNGHLRREYMVKIEGGRNLVRSDQTRRGLATAFGVERRHLDDFIDGTISVDEMERLILARRAGAPPHRPPTSAVFRSRERRDLDLDLEDDAQDDPDRPHPLETALFQVMASENAAYASQDFDAARAAAKEITWMVGPVSGHRTQAERLLDAARHLRQTSDARVTPVAIFAYLAFKDSMREEPARPAVDEEREQKPAAKTGSK